MGEIPQAYFHHGNCQSFVPNLKYFRQQVVSQGKKVQIPLTPSLPATLPAMLAAEARFSSSCRSVVKGTGQRNQKSTLRDCRKVGDPGAPRGGLRAQVDDIQLWGARAGVGGCFRFWKLFQNLIHLDSGSGES